MAPDGNKKKLVQSLREEALEWGTKMRMGQSSQLEAWTALHPTISAKLKYPVAACTLTETGCRSIMTPVIRGVLPKVGFSSTISGVVCDAPISSGGLGVLDLFHFMGTERTAIMLSQCWQGTPIGQLFITSIEELALDTGLYGPLWQQPYHQYSNWTSTHSLVYHACEYHYQNEIQIHIPHAPLKPKRSRDKSIMDMVAQHFPSKICLRAINIVRMLHEVVHLSDITTADGRSLDQAFLTAMKFPGQ